MSANGQIKLDGYTVAGRKNNPLEKRSKADSDYRKALAAAIAEIESSLLAKAFSLDPKAGEALAALLWFRRGLAEYNFDFREIRNNRNAKGGTNRAGTKGIVYWDPRSKIRTKWKPLGTGKTIVTVSQPHHIAAHEIAHALFGFENSREMRNRYKNFHADPYTNLWEFKAIEFENLVRDPGDVRQFHDPNKKYP